MELSEYQKQSFLVFPLIKGLKKNQIKKKKKKEKKKSKLLKTS